MCDCEVYEICPSCAPSEEAYANAAAAHDEVVRFTVPSPPSYTRTDLRNVIKEFLNDMENHGHATVFGADSLTDWKFETFLQWLAKREREGQ